MCVSVCLYVSQSMYHKHEYSQMLWLRSWNHHFFHKNTVFFGLCHLSLPWHTPLCHWGQSQTNFVWFYLVSFLQCHFHFCMLEEKKYWCFYVPVEEIWKDCYRIWPLLFSCYIMNVTMLQGSRPIKTNKENECWGLAWVTVSGKIY